MKYKFKIHYEDCLQQGGFKKPVFFKPGSIRRYIDGPIIRLISHILYPFASSMSPSSSDVFYYDENNLNEEILTVQNSGIPKKNHNRIEQDPSGYSQQCMYISIYDYLTLKLNLKITFEEFKKAIKLENKKKNEEWDQFDLEHRDALKSASEIYDLDIRVWQKNFDGTNTLIKSIWIHDDVARPRYRVGNGKKNIVNIAAGLRHFELIAGGSIFSNLFSEEDMEKFESKGDKSKGDRDLFINNDGKHVSLNDIQNDFSTILDQIENQKKKEKEFSIDKVLQSNISMSESEFQRICEKIEEKVDNDYEKLIEDLQKQMDEIHKKNENQLDQDEKLAFRIQKKQMNEDQINQDRKYALSIQDQEY